MDTKSVLEQSFVSRRLDGSNFRAWKFQMNAILRSQELVDIVDGTCAKPDETESSETKRKWQQRDGKAMAILFASINAEQSLHVLDCKSAKSIMDVLESIHMKKSDVRIMSLYEEYFALKMNEEESVTAYVSKVRTIASELEDQGEKLSDNLKMCRIVSSLTPKFQHFRTIWYNIKECRTMETLLAKLQLEEDQLNKVQREASQSNNNEAAFSASHTSTNKKKKKPLNERKAKSKCHACGEIGHWKTDNVCKGRKENKNGNNKQKGEITFLCANEILSIDYDEVWIADSGATRHTTFRRDWFTSFSSEGAQKGVKIANDEFLDVEGSGNIEIEAWVEGEWKTRILEDVRFVPKAKVNLFSINQLSKKGFDTRFTKDGCTVVNKNNEVVAIGYMDSNDLVRMGFKHVKADRLCLASNEKSSGSSLQQWHRRLGHVNVATIKHMCSNDLVSGIKLTNLNDFFCEECQLGKMHRASHPSTERRILEKGECFHVDLCGPMHENGINGAHFFMVLKDEATCFRFVYMLGEKSEVCGLLNDFLSQCENAWSI